LIFFRGPYPIMSFIFFLTGKIIPNVDNVATDEKQTVFNQLVKGLGNIIDKLPTFIRNKRQVLENFVPDKTENLSTEEFDESFTQNQSVGSKKLVEKQFIINKPRRTQRRRTRPRPQPGCEFNILNNFRLVYLK
jgi:hypothetical protein